MSPLNHWYSYRTDTFNFSETHNADGTTLYKEGPLSEPGIWYTLKAPAGSTAGGKVCYKYIGPQMSGTHCFWVYEEDGCYYGYGRNNITLDGPRSFNDWTARWIIKGSGKTCATPLS